MDIQLEVASRRPSSIASQMSRWVDEVLGADYPRYRHGHGWSPSINLYEDETSYCMVVDLAGVDPEAINLRYDMGHLEFSGDRPTPRRPEGADCPLAGAQRAHLMEIDQGPFHRRLKLPECVDPDGIAACYRSGFLWVRIPKRT